MLEATSVASASPAALVARAHAAAALFPYDHNLRRLPAALSVGMAAVIPMESVYVELAAEMVNDPHARDVAMQLQEVKQRMAAAAR